MTGYNEVIADFKCYLLGINLCLISIIDTNQDLWTLCKFFGPIGQSCYDSFQEIYSWHSILYDL